MNLPSEHTRHNSTGLVRMQHAGHTRKRPGSESDILDRPPESSYLQHQDSIQLGYHQRNVKLSTTGDSSAHVKPVYIWTQTEVQKWLRRHAPKAFEKYSNKITQHEITGRILINLNDSKLTRMGIEEAVIRNELILEILKLRLKNYMQCFKGLQTAGMFEIK